MWYEFNEDETDVTVKHPDKNQTLPRILWVGFYKSNFKDIKLDNNPYLTLSKVDKNGTKYYKSNTCSRCLGTGKVKYKDWHSDVLSEYECSSCKGVGKLKRAKTYKIHTHEYGKVLEQEYIEKQNETFYKENSINKEDNSTYCYIGDTYSIKTELKEKGAKYDKYLGWHSAEIIDSYPYIKVKAPVKKHEDGTIGLETIIYPDPDSSRIIKNPRMIEIKEQIKKASKEYLAKNK